MGKQPLFGWRCIGESRETALQFREVLLMMFLNGRANTELCEMIIKREVNIETGEVI